jgi:hypothetical protein
MSAPAQLDQVEWLFFDVFGTVLDCKFNVSLLTSIPSGLSADIKWFLLGKSHISATLCKIAERIEPEAHEAHPQPDDQFWLDRTQEWRTRFMKHVRTRLGNREEGGMDVGLADHHPTRVPRLNYRHCRTYMVNCWMTWSRSGELRRSGRKKRDWRRSMLGTAYQVRKVSLIVSAAI